MSFAAILVAIDVVFASTLLIVAWQVNRSAPTGTSAAVAPAIGPLPEPERPPERRSSTASLLIPTMTGHPAWQVRASGEPAYVSNWFDATGSIGQARTWAARTARFDGGAGWREKGLGAGEDSLPVLAIGRTSGNTVLGVCDGLGGAGARRSASGSTEAAVGSDAARAALEATAEEVLGRPPSGEGQLRGEFEANLASRFDELVGAPVVGGPDLRGTLVKSHPTTVAALFLDTEGPDQVRAVSVWAGDSRCYAWTPTFGLQLLTLDHTRYPDPKMQLDNEGPLTNLVYAGNPVALESLEFAFSTPVVFLVATDGLFSYHKEPGELEYRLLIALTAAERISDAVRLLLDDANGHAIDDVSLAMVAFPASAAPVADAVNTRCRAVGLGPSDLNSTAIPEPPTIRRLLPTALRWPDYRRTHVARLLEYSSSLRERLDKVPDRSARSESEP